jgi:hypothetical protein
MTSPLERIRWVPCHFIGEDGTGVLSVDDLFMVATDTEDEALADDTFAMLNATLMGNCIIKKMMKG